MGSPAWIEVANRVLLEEIRPRAAAMDQDPEALRWALNRLGEERLLALKAPVAYGGQAANEPDFRHFQELVARVSGALAFLQTQHQSAVSMILKADDPGLAARVLPGAASGETTFAIGFSQLRRGGPPILRAEPVDEGFRIDGHIPWITGFRFYEQVLIGATLPSGEAIFGIVPFQDSDHFRISEPMQLAAMGSALTVTADLDGCFLPANKVVFQKPAGWIHRNDEINIALQGHFALGCVQGSLDVLRAAFEKKGVCAVQEAHDALARELEECRSQTLRAASLGVSDETREQRLQLRAWAIELAVRAAHAAVTASSGAANSLTHPAQRLYREALVYTVSAQTTPILEATLRRLTR